MAGLLLAGIAARLAQAQSRMRLIFDRRRMEGIAGLVMSIPPWGLAVAPVVVIVTIFALQVRVKDRAVCAMAHLGAMVGGLLIYEAHREVLAYALTRELFAM